MQARRGLSSPPPAALPLSVFHFQPTQVCVPTQPGWSRAIIFGGSRDKKAATSPVAKLFATLPVWLLHIFSNRFLDSDLAFLHYQEQTAQQLGDSAARPA